MPPSDKHNTITKKSKVKRLGPHSPIFISQRPCPCLCPCLLKTLHQMSQLLFLLLSHMRTDDCSQLPLVVPTPFEAAKYIETPYQDLIQYFIEVIWQCLAVNVRWSPLILNNAYYICMEWYSCFKTYFFMLLQLM